MKILPIVCFICGKLGHSENFCKKKNYNTKLSVMRVWGLRLRSSSRMTNLFTNRDFVMMMGHCWIMVLSIYIYNSVVGQGDL